LELVLQLIAMVRPIAVEIAKQDRDLASQLRRALSSVALNVAEGFGSAKGNARLRFETARGSLYETQAALRVACAWGYIPEAQVVAALKATDSLGARLFGVGKMV
jgi:four helix bundle protein